MLGAMLPLARLVLLNVFLPSKALGAVYGYGGEEHLLHLKPSEYNL